jgi:zinc/manganese transport system substrate-binding protein
MKGIRSVFFKTLGLICYGAVLLLSSSGMARADQAKKLKVVSTISAFADIAASIGAERVEAVSIAPPRFNAHSIEPRPTDVLRVKRADLFIHAGLDLELWRGPLVDAAGNPAVRQGGERELDLSSVVKLLDAPAELVTRAQGDIHLHGNPHYWQDPENGRAIAQRIARKLSEIDSPNKDEYMLNLEKFEQVLTTRTSGWKKRFEELKGKELVGYHNEWIYLTDFLGISMRHFLEPKPGITPGPRHLEFLREYIVENEVAGIVQASFYPRKASETLAQDTGTKVAILCQNVRELESCPGYVEMLDYNITTLAELLQNE